MAGGKKRGYVPRNLKKNPWPVFRYACPPRGPEESEESHARRQKDAEGYNESCGVYLGLFQDMLTYNGRHHTCRLRLCRRKRRCSGRRDPHDPALMYGVFVPPCIPLEDDVIAPLKAELDSAVKALAAARLEARA